MFDHDLDGYFQHSSFRPKFPKDWRNNVLVLVTKFNEIRCLIPFHNVDYRAG